MTDRQKEGFGAILGGTTIMKLLADSKLSSGTSFTTNQNIAKNLNSYFIRSFPTDSGPNPFKGLPIDNFQKPNSVTKNATFYKIYSGGTSSTYGGITP